MADDKFNPDYMMLMEKYDNLKAENERLREAVQIGLSEMKLWESMHECDCPPEGHICGIRRLWSNINKVEQALAEKEQK